MHSSEFIQDLAIVMLLAGIVSILFHHFRQPVVLGYIAAGMIIGPHTPPFQLIHSDATIRTMAELGVVFLLFSLGLEFSLRKLFRVGATALVAAVSEIILMFWLGREIGRSFGWPTMDALFLGAIMAISSTTIIVKALDELGVKRERFSQLIIGILIVEDILAIGIIAVLSGIATSGSLDAGDAFSTMGRLAIFLVISLVVGLLTLPRLVDWVAQRDNPEMLLIAVLGLCFGFCLVVTKLGYSVALGAFLMGAILAEAKSLHRIETLLNPVRDLFSAIFFVAIGLQLDPSKVLEYAWPIFWITMAILVGKVLSCGFGTLVAGNDAKTSLKVGMGMAQIGEFSFVIASLGLSLGVTSNFLFPITVAVSALTTLTTPYMISWSGPVAHLLERTLPSPIRKVMGLYSVWLRSIRPEGNRAFVLKAIRRIVIQLSINVAIIAAFFLTIAFFHDHLQFLNDLSHGWRTSLAWSLAMLPSLPFLVAIYRKSRALGRILAELSVKPDLQWQFAEPVRRGIAEVIPLLSLGGIFLLLSALSSSILPPLGLLALAVIGFSALVVILWKRMIGLHAKLQSMLSDAMSN